MNRALLTILALAFAGAAQASGNADSGKSKAAQVCAACHGPEGNKPTAPENPILAGQHPDYLAKALKDYRSGKRNNPIMKGFAATLTNQDIADLAAYYSEHKK